MDNKENIIDSWITIEQLSEGNIKKNDSQYRQFNTAVINYREYFTEFLGQNKVKEKISDKNFEKSGLAIYFGIFSFQEIIDKLRKKYGFNATDEEISATEKFTFAAYFDKDLNFVPDKFFFTISGYIRNKDELPKNFLEAEDNLKDGIEKNFNDHDFNEVLPSLLKHFRISLDDCRFSFVKNLENDDVNLHSFFVEDLKKSKTVATDNLDRYFQGFSGERCNLDSKRTSINFNSQIFRKILQPKLYPLGRFPTNPSHPLSFMQQVAVNIAVNEGNDIRSVNGPPGTGKTTLLKDIFAELIVQQAKIICELNDKYLKATLTYWKQAKIAVLPPEITDKEIVVASSNNGAVKNIVDELPQIEKIGTEELKLKLLNADYFKNISNSFIEKEEKQSNFEEQVDEKNWGAISQEGGNSENLGILKRSIEAMVAELKDENYCSRMQVYEDFSLQYKRLFERREELQKLADKISCLEKLKVERLELEEAFKSDKVIRYDNKKRCYSEK